MIDSTRRNGLIFALTCSGVVGAFAPAARAADDPRDIHGLEEVVVTATKREASVQDVAMAVSAFTNQFRDTVRLEGAQDLASFTPGLTAQERPDDRLTIRGVGRTTNAPGSDPGIGVYVDGVYTTSTDNVNGSSMMIDRYEVLRGPQGTLYGRNTIGGAVNIISKRPTPEWTGELRAGFGNFNAKNFGASFSGPLSDSVRIRLDATKDDRDGFIKNLGPGNDLADLHTRQVSGQIEWDITEKLHLWVRGAYSEYDQAPFFRVLREQWRNDVFHEGLVIHPWFGYTETNPAIDNPWRIRQDEQQRVRNYAGTGILHLTYQAENFDVKYIGGYNQWNWAIHYDGDGIAQTRPVTRADLWGNVWTVPVQGTVDWNNDKRFQSHELQFLSNTRGKLDWVGGLYYYAENDFRDWDWRTPGNAWLKNAYLDGTQINWWETGTVAIPNPEARGWFEGGTLDAKAYAAFGQTGYRFSDAWKLTGGLRYSVDRKRGREFQQWWWMPQAWWQGVGGPLYSLLNPATGQYEAASVTGGMQTDTHKDRWSGVTGMASLEYRRSNSTLWYLTVSQGAKAGGFLLGALADRPTTPQDDGEVRDEKLLAYELGVKSDLAANLRVNAAAYFYDYDDMQTRVTVRRGSLSFNELINAHKARAYGLELEALWRPTANASVNLAASLSDSEITDFCGSNRVQNADGTSGCLVNWQRPGIAYDPSGHSIIQSPKKMFAANLSQDVPTAIGKFNVNVTYAYTGPVEYSLLYLEGSRAPGYDRVDLNASFVDAKGRFRVSAFVKNVTDSERPTVVGQDGPQYGPIKWMYYTYPRIYGAELRFNW